MSKQEITLKQAHTTSQGTSLPDVVPVEKEFLMAMVNKLDLVVRRQDFHEKAIQALQNRKDKITTQGKQIIIDIHG